MNNKETKKTRMTTKRTNMNHTNAQPVTMAAMALLAITISTSTMAIAAFTTPFLTSSSYSTSPSSPRYINEQSSKSDVQWQISKLCTDDTSRGKRCHGSFLAPLHLFSNDAKDDNQDDGGEESSMKTPPQPPSAFASDGSSSSDNQENEEEVHDMNPSSTIRTTTTTTTTTTSMKDDLEMDASPVEENPTLGLAALLSFAEERRSAASDSAVDSVGGDDAKVEAGVGNSDGDIGASMATAMESTSDISGDNVNDEFDLNLDVDMDVVAASPPGVDAIFGAAVLGIPSTTDTNTAAADTETDTTTTFASNNDDTATATSESSRFDSNAAADSVQWDVYVCQSKASKERGSSATLDAFVGLAPPSLVTVHPAILNKAKGKGPNVRCIPRTLTETISQSQPQSQPQPQPFEVNNVDSVDKVYRILTKHMQIPNINTAARECLKWNYIGNAHLEKNEITQAIRAYDRALATNHADQEGVLLLMRATAYLKRAFTHQTELRTTVSHLARAVPDPAALGRMYSLAADHPTLAPTLFKRVLMDCKAQDRTFRQTKFRHGLYEYALLHAARDSLRATRLLPRHAKAWVRAADSLAELKKLRESAAYYRRAVELDPSLEDDFRPVVERLEKSQQFLEKARAAGWSEDTLRLALDVAG